VARSFAPGFRKSNFYGNKPAFLRSLFREQNIQNRLILIKLSIVEFAVIFYIPVVGKEIKKFLRTGRSFVPQEACGQSP